MTPSFSLAEFFSKLSAKPRIVWLMLPSGEVIDQTIFGQSERYENSFSSPSVPRNYPSIFDKGGLVNYLQPGDIILDAGNSYYKDTIRRGKKLAKLGIRFADVGFSGGPGGARNGACLWLAEIENYNELLPLFIDGAAGEVEHFQGLGAGHFVKMVQRH